MIVSRSDSGMSGDRKSEISGYIIVRFLPLGQTTHDPLLEWYLSRSVRLVEAQNLLHMTLAVSPRHYFFRTGSGESRFLVDIETPSSSPQLPHMYRTVVRPGGRLGDSSFRLHSVEDSLFCHLGLAVSIDNDIVFSVMPSLPTAAMMRRAAVCCTPRDSQALDAE